MDPHNKKWKRDRDCLPPTPTPTPTGADHLSLPIRRWQRTLLEIRNNRCLLHLLLPRLFHVRLEDTFRRAIREELAKMLHYWNLPSQLLPDRTIRAQYWLVFLNKVQNPTFTTELVRDEKGDPIKVAIYDTSTQTIISPDCFLSSAKVRLMVLNAEFWENKGETWSRSEFNQSVLRGREGKGPILKGGSLTFRLENGVGIFENIVFNDNSSWTKSGFRLGVMVQGEGEESYLNGERVQEGVSEPFRVKDRRGKVSQKPIQLELKHKVGSLKNIGLGRASLLENNNIKTVSDFLWSYYHNQAELRKILGIKSDSDKGWITVVEHAKGCDNEFWASYSGFNNTSQPQEALLHPMERNMSLPTNCGPPVVGSGSSEPNPRENDIIEDTVYSYFPGLAQLDTANNQVQLEEMLANTESTSDNIFQSLSKCDSFDPGMCEDWVQEFVSSLLNCGDVGPPLTPRRKRKIKALFRSVAFVSVIRKRARIVPPANQTTVSAI
ncbi:calmodulin-binding protein 60 B-like isoform X2 [Carex rostrata]